MSNSAYKATRFPPEFVDFLGQGGADKVMFGSNFPMLMPRDCFEGFDALGLDARARKALLYDNALQVFGLDGEAITENGS